MRVALYEGSWEKYHKGTKFATEDNSTEFFRSIELGRPATFTAGLTLNTKDTDKEYVNTEDAFAHLFNKEDLSQIPEAVLWKKYSVADGVFHNLGGLLA